MEKTISPEQFYWAIAGLTTIIIGQGKLIYDLWKQLNAIKLNYLDRFKGVEEKVEHLHSNLEEKIGGVKGIFEEKCQFLSQALEHSLTKMEDRFDVQLGRVLDKLDEQNKSQLDFYKNYEVTPKKERSKKDV